MTEKAIPHFQIFRRRDIPHNRTTRLQRHLKWHSHRMSVISQEHSSQKDASVKEKSCR